MKDFIIGTYSFLLQLNVLVATIAGFVVGGTIGGIGLFGPSGFNMTWAVIGALIAFCNAALVSGAGLALDRIQELLEEQTMLLQQAERRQRSQGDAKK